MNVAGRYLRIGTATTGWDLQPGMSALTGSSGSIRVNRGLVL